MKIKTDDQELKKRAETLLKEIKGIQHSTIENAIQINKSATDLLMVLEDITDDIQPDHVNQMTKRMEEIDQWLFLGESLKKHLPGSLINMQHEMDQPLQTIWNKYQESLWFDTQAMSQLNKELEDYHQKTLNIPKEIKVLKADLKLMNTNNTLLETFKDLLVNIVQFEPSVWLKEK